jgi:hypothetical protein
LTPNTGPLRQVKIRGLEKVDWLFVFSCAAHNLIRLPRLMAQQEPQGSGSSAPENRGGLRHSFPDASKAA